MRRFAFNALVILSLLVFVISMSLWVRSYFVEDLVGPSRYSEWGRSLDYRWVLASSRGRITFSRQHHIKFFEAASAGVIHRTQRPRDFDERFGTSGGFRLLGFAQRSWYMMRGPQVWSGWQLAVPFWALCAATAALPCGWAVRQFRASRRSPYACATCGYDLRATPDRCPECGTVAEQTTVAR